MRDNRLRHERLTHAIRETLSELLFTETKDPRLHGVVISTVELSGDLKLARAFFSLYGDEERERQAVDGLNAARLFLRREMGRRMQLHSAPDLEFKRDKGYERADRVQRLLDTLDIQPSTDIPVEPAGDAREEDPTDA